MNPIYIHCHIFKNAGTSLIEAFKIAFPGRAVELEPAHPDDFLGVDDIEEYLTKNPDTVFISSHRILLPLPDQIAGREVFGIVLLRSPIERLESVYRFEHREPRRSVYSVLSKVANYEEFLTSILSVDYLAIVSNVQSKFCNISNDVELNNLKIKNQKILWGLVECYNESLGLIENHVNKLYPTVKIPVVKENTTKDNKLLTNLARIHDPGLLDKLISLNELDQKLVTKVRTSLFNSTAPKRLATISLDGPQNKLSRWIRIDSNDKPAKLLACKLDCNPKTGNFVFENEETLNLEVRISGSQWLSRLLIHIEVYNQRGAKIREILKTSTDRLFGIKIAKDLYSYKIPLKVENLETGLFSLTFSLLIGNDNVNWKIVEYKYIAAFGIKNSQNSEIGDLPFTTVESVKGFM